ncbi:hypothetical protein [Streptomyces bohaiensis]|uniref:DUF2637 domain-containing protein n=1 Tax=Streptomyces bohaiensis TaxID=1431344 RepID=A0ABX1C5L5_9ACTN|nr:hypothetical protein [Streptomyces bohaiensis]NJQ14213.1 hypothetical protein [Streptomyces bohaiensis]
MTSSETRERPIVDLAHRAVDGGAAIVTAVPRWWTAYLATCPVQQSGKVGRYLGYTVWGLPPAFIAVSAPIALAMSGPVVWVGCWAATVGACLLAAPTEEGEDEAPEKAATEAPQEAPKTAPEDVAQQALRWVHQTLGDRPGMHLSELLARGHSEGHFTDLSEGDIGALRAALTGWGIPVESQLKVGGVNRAGVRRSKLPPIGPPGAPTGSPTRVPTAA